MGWSLLGDVETGWFAKLAHGVEDAGRWVGNTLSGGSAGDRFYDGMARHADHVVSNINQQAIDHAAAHGATPQQALQAGSDVMEKIAMPQNVSDYVQLGSAGVQTATNTVSETVSNLIPSPDLGGLIAAGLVAGGALIACEMCSGPSSTPAVSRRHYEHSYA